MWRAKCALLLIGAFAGVTWGCLGWVPVTHLPACLPGALGAAPSPGVGLGWLGSRAEHAPWWERSGCMPCYAPEDLTNSFHLWGREMGWIHWEHPSSWHQSTGMGAPSSAWPVAGTLRTSDSSAAPRPGAPVRLCGWSQECQGALEMGRVLQRDGCTGSCLYFWKLHVYIVNVQSF